MAEVIIHWFIGGLSMQKLHIVGFSLGANLGGMIGHSVQSMTQGRRYVHRVTGLDLAGVGFARPNQPAPLNRFDALFNDNIHTAAKVLGFFQPTGDADFYPNDGLTQPGCQGPFEMRKLFCKHIAVCNCSLLFVIICSSVQS